MDKDKSFTLLISFLSYSNPSVITLEFKGSQIKRLSFFAVCVSRPFGEHKHFNV